MAIQVTGFAIHMAWRAEWNFFFLRWLNFGLESKVEKSVGDVVMSNKKGDLINSRRHAMGTIRA